MNFLDYFGLFYLQFFLQLFYFWQHDDFPTFLKIFLHHNIMKRREMFD